jgi:hypothetical protein
MQIFVSPENIKNAEQVLTLLQALQRERLDGGELLLGMTGGMAKDPRTFFLQNKIELSIGGRKYSVSKEAANLASEVGVLADKWRKELRLDLISPTIAKLQQWLPWLRQRAQVTIRVISSDEGLVTITALGQPGKMERVEPVLLALKSLNVTSNIMGAMEQEGELYLRVV